MDRELLEKLVESIRVSERQGWAYNADIIHATSLAEAYLAQPAWARDGGALTLNALAREVHSANIGWWRDLETGAPLKRNVGEMLMLMVSELAEAMEGHRKSLPDDKLPGRSMLEVELADCLIRILDFAAGMGLDLGGTYAEKMAYNRDRADHKAEARRGEHGKKY